LLYVVPEKRDRHEWVAAHFKSVTRFGSISRGRNGREVDRYAVYRVLGLAGSPLGRMP
jgi:hypothetical protein